MRRSRLAATVALAGILAATAAACSEDSASSSLPTPKAAFCEAAWNYDHRVERQAKLPEQIAIVEKIAKNAPKDIAKDAALFLDSLQRLQQGDKSVIDNPKITAAVERVNRRSINGCDFFKKEPGEGGI